MIRIRSKTKMFVAITGILLATLVLDSFIVSYYGNKQAEQTMLERARVLTVQMSAVWEYLDINQNRIDYGTSGEYEFKGVYCSVAGKTIAKFFSRDTDYTIHYCSVTPRKITAMPDEFEAEALFLFEEGSQEYWVKDDTGAKTFFRYASPLFIKKSCLQCHGSPEGELDVTGHPKEGMQVGDLAGAVSITIPIDSDLENITYNMWLQIAFFSMCFFVVAVVIYCALTKLYTRPLKKLESAVEQIDGERLDVDLAEIRNKDEIGSLAVKVEAMSAKLSKVYEDLEHTVEERTEELAEANRRLAGVIALLKEESEYKSHFLTIVSHDLRTPLTSILAFTDLWEKASETNSQEREALAVSEVKMNGQLLLHMVNNILEMARVDEGRITYNPTEVDLVDLADAAKKTLSIIAEKRQIALSVSVNPSIPIVYADKDKLKSVIDNLGFNAIKFTEPGGHVDISIDEVPGKDAFSITVRDDGQGIAEEDQMLIFNRFQQLDPGLNSHTKGTGLGLAIVKEFVELHEGTISVESEIGAGSTFTVELPLKTEEVQDEDYGC